MVRLWSCMLLAGCGFSSPDHSGDPSGGDAAVDSPSAACSGVRYGEAPFTVCLPAEPTGLTALNANGVAMINTDACTSTLALGAGQKVAQAQTGAPMLCVFAASTMSIVGTLTIRAQGSLPLALLSHGSLTIGSGVTIDVSGASSGASGNAAGCSVVDGGGNGNGGGGGAGGSFQTRGGNGAEVDEGGAGSTAASSVTPAFVRGGCGGGAGGNAGGSSGGLGGRGGGAIYLLARTQLRIDGQINASGGGGLAATQNGRGGGGGGGSGGMIALWGGNQIAMTAGAQIWANGGGGGGGSDDSNPGGDGGVSSSPGARGPGGASGASGATAGGDGAIDIQVGVDGGAGADKSGGGGGGGAGWIENVGPGTAITPGTFSPPAR